VWVGVSVLVAVWLVALGWFVRVARADGDPASDVLASQALFLAQDAGVTGVEQAELGADLGAVQRAGYQLRVAIIASAADLGSVTELWRRPRAYAAVSGHPLPAAAATAASSPEQSDTISWIVFASGAAVILAAWTASLRARPARLGKTEIPPRPTHSQ
jgi:hypothetical protein